MVRAYRGTRSSRAVLFLAVPLLAFSGLPGFSFVLQNHRTRPDRWTIALHHTAAISTADGRSLTVEFDDWDEENERNMEAVPESCLKCTGEVCIAALEAEQAVKAEQETEKIKMDDARLLKAVALTIDDEALRERKVHEFVQSHSSTLQEQYQQLQSEELR
mmetsp:Transcript_80821/g.142541  ORF Transcript_80821/g.142541 Transcript_80821/m.142541 type:complete len:161 (+) Transcript_80821:98-580(+)